MFDFLSHRDARAALRLAVQSAAAAAACFLIMQFLQMPEKFVGVLSAVLVVQPSIGNTLVEAINRLVATLVGCVIGIACLALLPTGYGTAAALALSMLVMNGIAGFRPEWRYGVVAAVALALGDGGDIYQTAIDRSLSIGLGAILGAFVAILVWPESARQQAHAALQRAFSTTADLLDAAVSGSVSEAEHDDDVLQSKFHRSLDQAREATAGITFGDDESLQYNIERTQRIYNSVLIINRVAEETSGLADEWDDLKTLLNDMREHACSALRELAETGPSDGRYSTAGRDRLDKLRGALEEATQLVTSESLKSNSHELLTNALVFGIKEVVENLTALTEQGSGGKK